MNAGLEALVDSLLYEGYALYPYTPGATKNATPTPFGIVYPPAYAAELPSAHDHLELRCVLAAPADAVLAGEVRFLSPQGERYEASDERIEVPSALVGALGVARPPVLAQASGTSGTLTIAVHLRTRRLAAGEYEAVLRVENRTPAASGLDRTAALRAALLSVHPLLRVTGGRFISPLERPCRSINTFPVLASPDDSVVLGAAIVLPDHPQIAPESRGSLFDSTEIEEALLLHVQTLSDDERADIERHDPAVAEMVSRAASATPAEILALHGRTTVRDRTSERPPPPPAGLPDPRAGQASAVVGGQTVRRGATVVLHPRPDADLQARMLDGRRATVERLFTDYDGRIHVGVTVDDDPGQALMRETGRYLFFFSGEVEVVGDDRR